MKNIVYHGSQRKKINEELNDNFYKWFGKSRMVDKDGNPLVFYRVTYSDFDVFQPCKWDERTGITPDENLGRHQHYFTKHKNWATNFAKKEFSRTQKRKQKLLQVYLKVENPLIIRTIQEHDLDWWYQYLNKYINITMEELEQLRLYKNKSNVTWQAIFNDTNIIANKCKEAGYDGLIIGDTKRDNVYSASVIVFDSNQIKSVDNNGEFSTMKNSIYEQLNTTIETNLNASFNRWFADSKIVDDNGNPLIVYHGTTDNIQEFDSVYGGTTTGNNEHGAFFFTNDESVADDYSRQAFIRRYESGVGDMEFLNTYDELTDKQKQLIYNGEIEQAAEEQIHKLGCYLRIENPLVVDCQGDVVSVELNELLIDYAKNGNWCEQIEDYVPLQYPQEDINNNINEIKEWIEQNYDIPQDEITEQDIADYSFSALQDLGVYLEMPKYDGIIMADGIDDVSDLSAYVQNTYIVFDPNQIKSVENRGNWSITSNNIFEQLNKILENYIDE